MNKFIELVKIELLVFVRDYVALFWTFLFPFFILVVFMSMSSKEEVINTELFFIEQMENDIQKQYFRELETKLLSTSLPISFNTLTSESSAVDLAANQVQIKLSNVHETQEKNKIKGDVFFYSNAQPTENVLGVINVIELLNNNLMLNEPRWTLTPSKLIKQKNDTSQTADAGTGTAQHMTIGLICMTILSTSLFGFSVVLVQLRATNSLKMYQIMPMGTALYSSAFIISRMLIMIIFSIIFIVIADITYSLGFEYSLTTLLSFILLVAIGSLTFICIGILVASRVTSPTAANGIINIIFFPLIFLSGLFFPIESNIEWLSSVASALPLKDYAIMFREIIFNSGSFSNFSNTLLIMFLWGGIPFFIAQKIFIWNAND
ncbi:ABC transporter permease [Colwellia sp. Bg11-28]|uniref:ABC transporter permease n=1 Tax=Colwellia sp. Bg11-28 TaxID=2058305 RepID=UPI000C33779C|nr:ABC transporter permease [Colwellia sp. Bg11-28]PKH85428.1 hypothetical protein CXF79_19385 [Colwellia sp. Bg11-28]